MISVLFIMISCYIIRTLCAIIEIARKVSKIIAHMQAKRGIFEKKDRYIYLMRYFILL